MVSLSAWRLFSLLFLGSVALIKRAQNVHFKEEKQNPLRNILNLNSDKVDSLKGFDNGSIQKVIEILQDNIKQWSFIESQLLEPNVNLGMPEIFIPLKHLTTTLEVLGNILFIKNEFFEAKECLERACPLMELLPVAVVENEMGDDLQMAIAASRGSITGSELSGSGKAVAGENPYAVGCFSLLREVYVKLYGNGNFSGPSALLVNLDRLTSSAPDSTVSTARSEPSGQESPAKPSTEVPTISSSRPEPQQVENGEGEEEEDGGDDPGDDPNDWWDDDFYGLNELEIDDFSTAANLAAPTITTTVFSRSSPSAGSTAMGVPSGGSASSAGVNVRPLPRPSPSAAPVASPSSGPVSTAARLDKQQDKLQSIRMMKTNSLSKLLSNNLLDDTAASMAVLEQLDRQSRAKSSSSASEDALPFLVDDKFNELRSPFEHLRESRESFRDAASPSGSTPTATTTTPPSATKDHTGAGREAKLKPSAVPSDRPSIIKGRGNGADATNGGSAEEGSDSDRAIKEILFGDKKESSGKNNKNNKNNKNIKNQNKNNDNKASNQKQNKNQNKNNKPITVSVSPAPSKAIPQIIYPQGLLIDGEIDVAMVKALYKQQKEAAALNAGSTTSAIASSLEGMLTSFVSGDAQGKREALKRAVKYYEELDMLYPEMGYNEYAANMDLGVVFIETMTKIIDEGYGFIAPELVAWHQNSQWISNTQQQLHGSDKNKLSSSGGNGRGDVEFFDVDDNVFSSMSYTERNRLLVLSAFDIAYNFLLYEGGTGLSTTLYDSDGVTNINEIIDIYSIFDIATTAAVSSADHQGRGKAPTMHPRKIRASASGGAGGEVPTKRLNKKMREEALAAAGGSGGNGNPASSASRSEREFTAQLYEELMNGNMDMSTLRSSMPMLNTDSDWVLHLSFLLVLITLVIIVNLLLADANRKKHMRGRNGRTHKKTYSFVEEFLDLFHKSNGAEEGESGVATNGSNGHGDRQNGGNHSNSGGSSGNSAVGNAIPVSPSSTAMLGTMFFALYCIVLAVLSVIWHYVYFILSSVYHLLSVGFLAVADYYYSIQEGGAVHNAAHSTTESGGSIGSSPRARAIAQNKAVVLAAQTPAAAETSDADSAGNVIELAKILGKIIMHFVSQLAKRMARKSAQTLAGDSNTNGTGEHSHTPVTVQPPSGSITAAALKRQNSQSKADAQTRLANNAVVATENNTAGNGKLITSGSTASMDEVLAEFARSDASNGKGKKNAGGATGKDKAQHASKKQDKGKTATNTVSSATAKEKLTSATTATSTSTAAVKKVSSSDTLFDIHAPGRVVIRPAVSSYNAYEEVPIDNGAAWSVAGHKESHKDGKERSSSGADHHVSQPAVTSVASGTNGLNKANVANGTGGIYYPAPNGKDPKKVVPVTSGISSSIGNSSNVPQAATKPVATSTSANNLTASTAAAKTVVSTSAGTKVVVALKPTPSVHDPAPARTLPPRSNSLNVVSQTAPQTASQTKPAAQLTASQRLQNHLQLSGNGKSAGYVLPQTQKLDDYVFPELVPKKTVSLPATPSVVAANTQPSTTASLSTNSSSTSFFPEIATTGTASKLSAGGNGAGPPGIALSGSTSAQSSAQSSPAKLPPPPPLRTNSGSTNSSAFASPDVKGIAVPSSAPAVPVLPAPSSNFHAQQVAALFGGNGHGASYSSVFDDLQSAPKTANGSNASSFSLPIPMAAPSQQYQAPGSSFVSGSPPQRTSLAPPPGMASLQGRIPNQLLQQAASLTAGSVPLSYEQFSALQSAQNGSGFSGSAAGSFPIPPPVTIPTHTQRSLSKSPAYLDEDDADAYNVLMAANSFLEGLDYPATPPPRGRPLSVPDTAYGHLQAQNDNSSPQMSRAYQQALQLQQQQQLMITRQKEMRAQELRLQQQKQQHLQFMANNGHAINNSLNNGYIPRTNREPFTPPHGSHKSAGNNITLEAMAMYNQLSPDAPSFQPGNSRYGNNHNDTYNSQLFNMNSGNGGGGLGVMGGSMGASMSDGYIYSDYDSLRPVQSSYRSSTHTNNDMFGSGRQGAGVMYREEDEEQMYNTMMTNLVSDDEM